MKILYAAQLSESDSALYRLWALERLGHVVVPLNSYAYEPGSEFLKKIQHRAQVGPWVARLNRDVLAIAERERPEVFWADKLLGLQPQTLRQLRAGFPGAGFPGAGFPGAGFQSSGFQSSGFQSTKGIVSVSYMIDNAFGTRGDPGWRLYRKCIPEFDLHVVQRDSNFADYQSRGARDVIKVQTAYEPTVHFPESEDYVQRDERRRRGVSFIGTAYGDRPELLTRLWRACGLPVTISGSRVWRERLDAEAVAALYTGTELYGPAYREAVWDSKINLSFLTHSNHDEFVHKSFEIAACGGFLLAERSAGHLARFVEDEEAVFFTGFDECAEKIRRYLPDAAARGRIAAAGRSRAVSSGYGNDAQMAKIVQRLEEPQTQRPQGTRKSAE